MSETARILAQARKALIDTVVSENGKRRLAEMFDQAVEQRVRPRLTDYEYDDLYDRIYARLKRRGVIYTRGGHDYVDTYAQMYLDGVEAALTEVQKLG